MCIRKIVLYMVFGKMDYNYRIRKNFWRRKNFQHNFLIKQRNRFEWVISRQGGFLLKITNKTNDYIVNSVRNVGFSAEENDQICTVNRGGFAQGGVKLHRA